MPITKTDFIEYTFCRKNLWLKKYKPELFEGVELSEFELKIIEEGNAADEAARGLFPGGVSVDSYGAEAVRDTEVAIADGASVLFQATFTAEDFYIRADVMRFNAELGGWELYEVKATNAVKRKAPQNYIHDLAMQKIVIEKCGLKVVTSGVIHLNKKYRKQGEIDYSSLFITVDVTDEVNESLGEVEERMNELKQYLAMPEERGCDCIYQGRSKHCTTFAYSNPDVPEYSVHDLRRIGTSKRRLTDWIDQSMYSLDDIRDPEALNDGQRLQLEAYRMDRPIIDYEAIEQELASLTYPLYFFDYEGDATAIPIFDGFSPYEHVPFQYSLHILQKNGEIEHREFLITEMQPDITKPLIEQLRKDIGNKGTVVSWYAQYEQGRNRKLAQLHPEHARFLEEMNDTMFDLEKLFSKNLYVHPEFKGSTSIKSVLPILVPELSYKTLGIQKGVDAVERWEYLMTKPCSAEEKAEIIQHLLAYCKMDTWAMVKIFEHLKSILSTTISHS